MPTLCINEILDFIHSAWPKATSTFRQKLFFFLLINNTFDKEEFLKVYHFFATMYQENIVYTWKNTFLIFSKPYAHSNKSKGNNNYNLPAMVLPVSFMYTDLLINPNWNAVRVFSTYYKPSRHGRCTYIFKNI